jgi:hypothetical protein
MSTLLKALAISAVGLGAMVANAQAAPLGNLTSPSEQQSAVVKARYGCWWQNGVRHCARGYGYRSRYREYGFPENYRTGSNRWWQEMDRTDRGGRGSK